MALVIHAPDPGRSAAQAQTAAGKGKARSSRPAKVTVKVPELDLAGLQKTLARDPKARRPLLLNFWATWCDPCREEFPDLVKLANEFGPRGLEFAAVSFDMVEDAQTAIPAFLKQVKAQELPVFWLNVPDPEPAIKLVDPDWGGGIPITFVFDADGKLVFKHMGRFNYKELREAIEKTVAAK
ncbi:MAG: TlpA disulfide reductase family protein [Pyrinomonadaceae bacterium]